MTTRPKYRYLSLRLPARHEDVDNVVMLFLQSELNRLVQRNWTGLHDTFVGRLDSFQNGSVAKNSAYHKGVLIAPIFCLNVIFLPSDSDVRIKTFVHETSLPLARVKAAPKT